MASAAPRRNRKFKVSLSQHSNGVNSYWRLHYTLESKSHRPYFKTRKEADVERKRLLELHGNIGTSGSALLATQTEQQDAAAALKILAPHGRSLTEAAEYFEREYLRFSTAKTFQQHFNDLIVDLEQQERRPKSIMQVKDRNAAFLSKFGPMNPRELSGDVFCRWFWDIKKEKDWSIRTCHHTKIKISQLMNHILKQEGMSKNLSKLLKLPKVPEKKVEIYNLQQVVSLLHHSQEFGLQNYFAIGFFAGLRPEREALELWVDDFYLHTKQILVPERLGKSLSRSVNIHPTLSAWLDKHLPDQDPVTDSTNFVKRRNKVFEAAGFKLVHDGVRHTFGSMCYIQTGDKPYTIERMGHKGDYDIFDKNYKRLVTKDIANAYWKLTPEVVAQLIKEQNSPNMPDTEDFESPDWIEWSKLEEEVSKDRPAVMDKEFTKGWISSQFMPTK